MHTQHDYNQMAIELLEDGFNPDQLQRYEQAFEAAKVAALWVMCAQHGRPQGEMLKALHQDGALACELDLLVARMEVCPAFVGYIHSGLPF